MPEAHSQPPCRILVMASGNGSNLQALLNAVASQRIPNSTITRLIVNRAKAYATQRAEAAGVPWEYYNLISHGFLAKGSHSDSNDRGGSAPSQDTEQKVVRAAREKYDAALADKVLALEPPPELIVLAGWMHVFSRAFLEPLASHGVKVINLHPALPGAYDGAGAIERAFSDFKAGKANKTGIMVHYVIVEVDRGDPIMVQEIEWQGEDLPQLEERIHSYEHELIVKATAKVSQEILEQRSK